jgi:tRNA dimethylallyltransferase
MQYPVPNPLVMIVGSTAVGKSRIAIEVARLLNGEIVSADSRLFYRGMDIGTAKPSNEERKQIKHHLIDIAEPDEIISLRVFLSKAQDSANKIINNNKLPILVGGTGQYIHAISEGWTIPPQKPDEKLRTILFDWANEIGIDGIHQKLVLLDPVAAEKIDPRNVRRTIRALEVILGTGKLFSNQRSKAGSKYDLKMIGLFLSREMLHKRIDNRINQMISDGLIEEVKNLLSKGYSPDLHSMSAIGYHEISDYLQNKITYEDAIMLMKRRTRQFVRRQANWFKFNDPNIHWFAVSERIVEEITEFVQSSDDWITK